MRKLLKGVFGLALMAGPVLALAEIVYKPAGGGSGTVSGSGSAGYMPYWTAGSTLGDSNLYQPSVGKTSINTTANYGVLHVATNTASALNLVLQRAVAGYGSLDFPDVTFYSQANPLAGLYAKQGGFGVAVASAGALVENVFVSTNGNTGFGVSNPTSKIHVLGTVAATAFSGDGSALTNLSAIESPWNRSGTLVKTTSTADSVAIGTNTLNGNTAKLYVVGSATFTGTAYAAGFESVDSDGDGIQQLYFPGNQGNVLIGGTTVYTFNASSITPVSPMYVREDVYPMVVQYSTNATPVTTSTSPYFGSASYSGTANVNANWVRYRYVIPDDIDTSTNVVLSFYFRLSAADTSSHTYVATFSTYAASAAMPTTSNITSNSVTLQFTADASGAQDDLEYVRYTSAAWGSAMTAGTVMLIDLARSGDATTTDVSTVASYGMDLVMNIRRKLKSSR